MRHRVYIKAEGKRHGIKHGSSIELEPGSDHQFFLSGDGVMGVLIICTIKWSREGFIALAPN